jgi:CelD/BcsL family acetyltransferase involved in cellulose biosynthesis
MHAPLSPVLRVEWRGLDTLEAVTAEWRGLVARALEPNVFYTPEFMMAAAPVFGAGAGATLIWSEPGRLMGLFPTGIERAPFARAVGWTHPFAPLGTPLVDCDEPEAVIAAWLDHLTRDHGTPRLLLMPLAPTAGPFAAALAAVLKRSARKHAIFGRHQRALLAPGGQRERYIERAVSAGRRKELRRQRRRLTEIAPVTFVPSHGPADVADALKDFLIIEVSGWKGLAGTAAGNDPAICRFMEAAVAALAAEGRARVDRLMFNGHAVAVGITLTSGDAAWCWKIAYSEGVARFSPGVQLMVELTDRLLAEPAIVRVDSCATADHPMIDHIWRERLELCDRLIALRPPTLPFGLHCGVETLRRSAIGVAKAVRDRVRGR